MNFEYKINDIVEVSYNDEIKLKKVKKAYDGQLVLDSNYWNKEVGQYVPVYLNNPLKGMVIVPVRREYPELTYGGNTVRVEDMIVDDNQKVSYLRIVGQEEYIRSISALILQGKTKFDDKQLNMPYGISAGVHSGGMRRLLSPLGNGQVDCVLYHINFIPNVDMRFLWAGNDEGFASFKSWLQEQSIPRIKGLKNGDDLELLLFDRLKGNKYIQKLPTLVGKQGAYLIADIMLKDEYFSLRDMILNIISNIDIVFVGEVA